MRWGGCTPPDHHISQLNGIALCDAEIVASAKLSSETLIRLNTKQTVTAAFVEQLANMIPTSIVGHHRKSLHGERTSAWALPAQDAKSPRGIFVLLVVLTDGLVAEIRTARATNDAG